jgi:hypothetical protein|tara:strand:- start:2660 stop:3229 length:570 start_codon:yes stop_codon:yes gene_type:complete
MEIIKVRITGNRPLLMHSDKFADPLHPATKAHKELTGKRKKTDEDHEAIAKSEWAGGMYRTDDLGPCIPDKVIEGALYESAKLRRLGKVFKRAIEVVEPEAAVEYKGPRDLEGMWAAGMYDARSVKVTTSRLMRYRPIFKQWACQFTIMYDPALINRSEVKQMLEEAGMYCGIGDYRPKFGRFDVEEVK